MGGKEMLKNMLRLKFIIPAVFGSTALFVFIFFGPPDVYTLTSSPAFCSSCHVMEYQYDAWLKTGLHRNIKCVECHLPNDNFPNHMAWKGIDGTKDVIFFYGRLFSEPMKISDHGKAVAQKNCVRCHGEMVSRITLGERTCWSCHRRVTHKAPLTGDLF
jgi:cytochrome c nitrite reductase small subunit